MRNNATLLLLLLSFAAPAWATPRIHHWVLDNGVRVYFAENRQLPIVDIYALFDAGAARDPSDRRGLAYMTATMLDEGTSEQDATAVAESFAAKGIEFSAGVAHDYVRIGLRSLSEDRVLQPGLRLYARLLATPTFPPASVERQKRNALVALEEEKQSPGEQAQKIFRENLYGLHPYANRDEGDEAGLRAISADDLRRFHGKFYVGRNAVLAIAGDLDLEAARRIAQTAVGALPAGEAPPALALVADMEKAVLLRRNFPATQSHIIMGQPGVYRGDPDYFALYVGNYILGGEGLNSRVFNEVRERRGLAYSAQSYFSPMRRRGPFLLALQTRNDQRERALSVLKRTLQTFVAEGPTEAELIAAKKYLIGSFPLQLDSNRDIANYISVIGFYGLPLTYLEEFADRVSAVTVTSVRDAFRRRVHPDKMITVVLGGAP